MILVLFILLFGTRTNIIGCLGKLFEVERYDNGDAFAYWSEERDCAYFNGYPHSNDTMDCTTTLGCCCNYRTTFNTLSGKCEELYDEKSKGTPGGLELLIL